MNVLSTVVGLVALTLAVVIAMIWSATYSRHARTPLTIHCIWAAVDRLQVPAR